MLTSCHLLPHARFLQAEHAKRLVARGVGVISREAPAYRKADKDPPHFTAESIKTLVQEVRLGCGLSAAVVRVGAQLGLWLDPSIGGALILVALHWYSGPVVARCCVTQAMRLEAVKVQQSVLLASSRQARLCCPAAPDCCRFPARPVLPDVHR